MPEADPAERIVDRRAPGPHSRAPLQLLGLELGEREVGRCLDQNQFTVLFRRPDNQVVAHEELSVIEAFPFAGSAIVKPHLLARLQIDALEIAIIEPEYVVAITDFLANAACELVSENLVLASPDLRRLPGIALLDDSQKRPPFVVA